MNKYAVLAVAALFAAGISAIHAEGSDPFAVDISGNGEALPAVSERSLSTGSSSTQKATEVSKKGDFPVQGTVQGDNLRIRQWPWGPIIGEYDTGASLTVTGVSGEFYAVTINGVSGYMHKNYVSIPGAAASREVPYYPGNTAMGGYLSEAVGKAQSTYAASGKSYFTNSTPSWSNSSGSSVNYSSSLVSYKGIESPALANYTGGKLSPSNYIALFGPAAQDSMKVTGVPASVTLAQSILETGWGKSSIGDAKNLFGIKGTGPAGTTLVNTKECYDGKTFVTIKDGFRKYNTWEQSINDHASLLQSSRYVGALNTYNQNHNADQYAYGIQKAGYATAPNYASTLISLMKQYNLYEWDV